ncbi:MAG: hypothetical protein LBM69_05795 [Lachnospiraceae bacterium]|nr:hypothetical protein [Lachnospiraceae bacterium]
MDSQKKDTLVLCDHEADYVTQMAQYMKAHQEIPFDIRTYTNVKALLEAGKEEEFDLLIVAENAYSEEVNHLSAKQTILLNESGKIGENTLINVDKYQRADTVCREIYAAYLEAQKDGMVRRLTIPKTQKNEIQIIGMYSPIRRCLQTSFALTLGQMLAQKHKTIYLNFEHYAGITEILPDIQTKDLSDLLYIMNTGEDKFRLWMPMIVKQKGELHYIPPMRAGDSLQSVTAQEWIHFIMRISAIGEYEYIILDLTENMQGLYDILRFCKMIFTLTKDDPIAQSKIVQYEHILQFFQYEDVLNKTHRLHLPLFHHLPEQIEQYTKSELANYIRSILKELELL